MQPNMLACWFVQRTMLVCHFIQSKLLLCCFLQPKFLVDMLFPPVYNVGMLMSSAHNVRKLFCSANNVAMLFCSAYKACSSFYFVVSTRLICIMFRSAWMSVSWFVKLTLVCCFVKLTMLIIFCSDHDTGDQSVTVTDARNPVMHHATLDKAAPRITRLVIHTRISR